MCSKSVNPRAVDELESAFLNAVAEQWLSSRHCLDINHSGPESFINSHLKNENASLAKVYHSANDSGNWLMAMRPMKWDSEHFGLKMGKISPFILPQANPADKVNWIQGYDLLSKLLSDSDRDGYEHINALVHPEDTLGIQLLSSFNFQLMDTTVMYELNLEECTYSFKKSTAMRLVGQEDLPALRKISAACFADRSNNINRFNSDPYFESAKVRKLYKSWVTNSYTGKLADQFLLIEWEGEIAGFITIQNSLKSIYGSSASAAQIPINAVAPQFKGKGLYRTLVEHVLYELKESGTPKVEIWTHVSNNAVHRVWQSLGARIVLSGHQMRRVQKNNF